MPSPAGICIRKLIRSCAAIHLRRHHDRQVLVPADYKEMLALDADGKADTIAKFYPIKFVWDNPNDSPDAGKQTFDTMWPITELVYHQRGGQAERLPSRQKIANQGRADARLAMDASGELYIYSKGDAMIRQVVGCAPNNCDVLPRILVPSARKRRRPSSRRRRGARPLTIEGRILRRSLTGNIEAKGVDGDGARHSIRE